MRPQVKRRALLRDDWAPNLGRDRIRIKLLAFLLLIAAGIFTYHHYASGRNQSPAPETVYVLPSSLEVGDAPASIRLAVETVHEGDQVQVLQHTSNWVKVKLADKRTGWIESKNLLDSQTYETAQKLLKDLDNVPVQAEGHAPDALNLRFGPSRDSATLAQLPKNQKLNVFGRKIIERPSQFDQPSSPQVKEAWYLVRAGARAGWVLGRFVSLDIPEPISSYAQSSNMVAWLVLDTVVDEDRQVPQYIVADRIGNQDVDFTHIRVFTWWVKNHRYVTSYVESDLQGYFPIRVVQTGNVPYFRLHLVDKDSNKVQRVYGLFDTRTRPVGIVEGWETDAMPTQSLSTPVAHRR